MRKLSPLFATLLAISGAATAADFEYRVPLNLPVEALPQLVASPAPLLFGETGVGQTVTRMVTLTNPGARALAVSSVEVSPPFAQTNDCGAPIAANGSCRVTVSLRPNSAGPLSGNLSILTQASARPLSVPVSATAVEKLALQAITTTDFGTVTAGSSASLQFSVTNVRATSTSGVYPLVTGSSSLSIVDSNCGTQAQPVTLAPNTSCYYSVRYAPGGEGALANAYTQVHGAITGSPVSLALAGQSPIKHSFATETAGTGLTVPAGVSNMTVLAWGAGGGGQLWAVGGGTQYFYGTGGGGGFVQGTFPVTPGQQLTVVVGQGGISNQSVVGAGGGGTGGFGGGGYSGVFLGSPAQANALAIAGGGGGGGRRNSGGLCYSDKPEQKGGGAGGLTGQAAADGQVPSYIAQGGTQTAGGASPRDPGKALLGGNGVRSSGYACKQSGGGGGGYWGGGSGAIHTDVAHSIGYPGAGGSSYLAPGVTNAINQGTTDSTPANLSHPDRGTAGQGGGAKGNGATSGKVVVMFH